jgi:predicted ATPase
LASDVRLHWLSDRHYEVQIQHPRTKEYQNLADVGQANSQVIPVLVGGLRLSAGSTYLVEEPEIHLHPRAQADLGDFFVDLYERGVAAIVETHSEYLVLRLQQHVAAGRLPPAAIKFVYVDATPARKRVSVLHLDDKARFVEALPGGFFPHRLAEARKLARLRDQANE